MREAVVDQVARALGAVRSRRVGVAVGLWGEAGIGKTWTAQQVLHRVGCPTLSLHATLPDAALLRALPHPTALPGWARVQLERLERGEHLEPNTCLNTLVAILSGLAPFVLSLEDLHECDPERREMIAQLAGSVERARGVGLLVSSRQPPPPPLRALRLEPLSAGESRVLLETVLGAALPPEALSWLQARTGGNPLFALEFQKYLARQGFLWSDGLRWHWRSPPDGFLPVTVEALVGQLILHPSLQPESVRVLEARTLVPESLPPEVQARVWAQMAALSPDQLEQARALLESVGLVRGTGFAHPLFGEVLRSGLGGRRQDYARRALEALIQDWPEQAALFLEGHPLALEQSLELLERAAAQAGARGDLESRAALKVRAVRCAPPELRALRALELARELRHAALPGALELAELALAGGDPEALYLYADLLVEAGRFEDALRQMARFLEDPASKHSRARRHWALSLHMACAQGQFAEALERWAEQPRWQHGLSATLYRLVGAAHAYTGRLEEAEAIAQRLLRREDLGPEGLQQARNLLGQVLNARGNWSQLFEVEQETIALARRMHSLRHLAMALLNHSLSLSSHPPDTLSVAEVQEQVSALIDEAGHHFIRLGMTLHYGVCLLRRAGIQMERGLFQEAETLLLEGHSLLERGSPRHWNTESHLKQSRLYLDWQPPYGPPLARKHAQAALELARTSGDHKFLSTALEYAARAEAQGGDPGRALAYAHEALKRAAASPDSARVAEARFAYALVLESTGALEQACTALSDAAEQHRARGDLRAAHRAGLEQDRIRGDLEGARVRWRWFSEAGHLALAQRVVRYFPALERPAQGVPAPQAHPQARARLKVLGPVLLEREDQEVLYRGHKRSELLAYLLERRIAGQPGCTTLELLDTLYPGVSEEEGKHTLRQHVYLIRGDLGSASVLSTPGGYALGAVSSDAEDFLAAGDLALWRGPYLEGLGEGWISGVRDALFLALRNRLESTLEHHSLPLVPLLRSLCGMQPYDPQVLGQALGLLCDAAGDPAARMFYLERRPLLLEVGEALPARFEDFLELTRRSLRP